MTNKADDDIINISKKRKGVNYMNTLFLYLHLLFIILSIVNVICFMKLINKISSKQGKDKPGEYPKCCVHESKGSKVDTVVCVHEKECDDSVNKLQGKFMDVDLELIKIKSGEIFTVLVDDSPVTDVDIDLSGTIKYKTIRDEVPLFIFNPKPAVMNLSEAKNIAEKLNGKVVFVGDCKSVVYDYTKE